MSAHVRLLLIIVVLAATVPARAEQGASDAPPRQKYILMFAQPNASSPARTVRDQDVAALGGTVEYRSFDRMIVTLPETAANAIRKHHGVKYTQKAIRGRQPSSTTPPDTSARLGQQSASSRTLRPEVHTVWDSGTYTYDGAGNVATIGSTNSYSYDRTMRLVQANIGSRTESYTYDPFGNQTERKTDDISFPVSINSQTNRVSGYSHDVAGNLTGAGTVSYTYDPFNMMILKQNGSVSEAYLYTADDERLGAKVGSRWIWSFRDSAGRVIRQFDSLVEAPFQPWRWIEDYVYRDGQLVGAERESEEGGRRHFHLDHLGTPRLITGTNGLIVSRHDYFPFGNEITPLCQEYCSGFDREEPMKYTGHERDFTSVQTPNTNYVDYMHARSTNPSWGRFLSVDPVMDVERAMRNPQAWNRYSYANNNPINLLDPDGRQAINFQLSANADWRRVQSGTMSMAQANQRAEARLVGALLGLGAAAGLRTVGSALVSWVLRNPNNARQLADAALSPPGSSAIPNAEAIGAGIGQALRGKANQMASIVEQVTASNLTQSAAATAAEAAVKAIGLNTAGIVRVGDELIVTSARTGANQYVLIVDAAGKVRKGFATIELDEAGRTLVRNVE